MNIVFLTINTEATSVESAVIERENLISQTEKKILEQKMQSLEILMGEKLNLFCIKKGSHDYEARIAKYGSDETLFSVRGRKYFTMSNKLLDNSLKKFFKQKSLENQN
jgi:hypothetical protein